MKSEIENPPAFPFTPTDRSGQIAPTQPGMSLRDWFAGMALQALLQNHEAAVIADLAPKRSEWMAWQSYEFADAMLEQRAKEESK